MRADLKMRKGKAIAQGSHASMKFLVDKLAKGVPLSAHENKWLFDGSFTKICLRVDSEEELFAIHRKARAWGITSKVIVDNGKTEFHGNKTPTCLAIGPNAASLIDNITGDLKLY
mgnify:CR=1 FL=1